MKYIALAVLLAVIQTGTPVPPQTTNNSTDAIQNGKNRGDANRTPAPQSAIINGAKQPEASQGHSSGQRQDDTQHSVVVRGLPPVTVTPPKRDWADWGFWCFNLLLVVVGGFQIWLLTLTWKIIRRQTDIQEAGLTQWVDLEPDGLLTKAEVGSSQKPKTVTIQPRWRVLNNTPLPLTIETIETHVARDLDWEVSQFDVDEIIPPAREGHNYFTFFVPVRLTESETANFLSHGMELSIMVGIIYRGASGKQVRRSFGDFYVCGVGKLEINKPIGKGPQSQRIEKDASPSTLVWEHVRILEDQQEPPLSPPQK